MRIAGQEIRSWLTASALPLWASVGVDTEGGFVESLDLHAAPNLNEPKRLLVQARQIYVYSHAHLSGFGSDFAAVAWAGYKFMRRAAWTPGAGWAHRLARDGTVIDPNRDCYDHAFLLFSLAWLFRATGEKELLAVIDDTISFMDRRLSHPSGLGFRENLGASVHRRQNPHMHLFEAWLALFEATLDERYLDRARSIQLLLANFFLDSASGMLRELFSDDLRKPESSSTDFFEPGHHFEWAWLLRRFAELAGEPVSDLAQQLLVPAGRHGFGPSGLVLDEIWMNGLPKKRTSRCWPQTEALKAALRFEVHNPNDGVVKPETILAGLFHGHLATPIAGTWWDTLAEDGSPQVERIPATTFYHVFMAFSEWLECEKYAFPDG